MKVGIEARALSASMGVRTYVRELVRNLLTAYPDDSFTIAYDHAQHRGTFPRAQEIVVPLQHEVLLPLWLRRTARELEATSPRVLHFTKAAVPAGLRVPAVVTIYDVIPLLFPQGQTPLRRWYWRRELARAAARAQHIITISEASKQDLIRVLNVPAEKITATPLAVDTQFFSPQVNDDLVQKKYGLTAPYLMTVGTLEPRKNIPLLIRAFARIASSVPHHLVVVGKAGLATAAVTEAIRRSGMADRIHWLSSVPDVDIPALLTHADLFVFPSVYEGWGFPPLEAMACGTAAIVSNGGALPEAVGSAAEVVQFTEEGLLARTQDAAFEAALAERLQKLLLDSAARNALAAQGSAWVHQRTWRAVAEATHDVYAAVSLRT